jgi:hypothetical protein
LWWWSKLSFFFLLMVVILKMFFWILFFLQSSWCISYCCSFCNGRCYESWCSFCCWCSSYNYDVLIVPFTMVIIVMCSYY